jgi:DNA-binding NtrC family response regulator
MKAKPPPEPVLCVDPHREVVGQLRHVLQAVGSEVVLERDLGRVLERFERESFSVLVMASNAVRASVDEGIELLEMISGNSPATQIVFLVHPKDLKLTRRALKAGAYQYAKLPVSDEELSFILESALDRRPQYGPNLLLKDEEGDNTFENMVGGSSPMRNIYRLIRQAAATDIPVLLSGETGTGKDLAARAIHQLSRRSDETYYPVHLGALPEDLVSSELFGHEKGAFTGALERRLGCFELANQGTVFLDEISTIDEKIQVSLLRLLEDHRLHRIGGSRPVQVDVRVIAASNEDLEQSVRQGEFREDLFFRLEVMHIHLPPLRDRHGDVPLLLDHFLKRYNEAYGKEVQGVSPEAVAVMESYRWPGNVRELKNVINRAVVLSPGEVILPEHLPNRLRRGGEERPVVAVPVGTSLADMERALLTRTLSYTAGNRSRAADLLGISRRALYNKLERFDLK